MTELKVLSFVSVLALLSATVGCSVEEADDDADAGSGGSSAGSGGSSAGTSSGAGTGGSGGSGGGGMCVGATFDAEDENNYAFSSTLMLPSVKVQPDTELHFEWPGITKDFLKHDLDPRTGVDNINVIIWQLSEAELAQKLNDDTLLAEDGQPPAVFQTMNAATSADLFDFTAVAGEPIPQDQLLGYLDVDNYPPAENTYTAILATGSLSGEGDVKMIQAFTLDPASTNTTVTLTNTSTALTYSANLHELTPIMVPAGNADITMDWGDVMINAMGNEFIPSDITRIRISHYNETPAELEAKFLDLELIDTATYEADVPIGDYKKFSELMSESGQAFTGIDGTGTWLVALFCGRCRNPAPLFMSILKPCN